jgi:(3,5-dihydroxyphenyl)acetyl-CoA 1,2-dioxygenase
MQGTPPDTADFASDGERYSRLWASSAARLAQLPAKPARSAGEAQAAENINSEARAARSRFLAAHAEALYARLTHDGSRFVRAERLVYDAASLVPGLAPRRSEVAAESARRQHDKEGIEIDQGILLSALLARPRAGSHLCHAMLLPRPEALARLPELEQSGRVDLGAAEVLRDGKASHVVQKNPRHLNAEDDGTLAAFETAVDLALLDPRTEICVLRGGPVQSGARAGRRVFGSGINLTHLYHGKIPFLWYLERDLGVVNKIYRGLAREDAAPGDIAGNTLEKPWIAAVDGFAIGGHCQYLLVMDYVVAGEDAYMTLPARKEGIIPGAANLRLPRFVGDRLARQAIMAERRIDCASPEGRMICDEVVAPDAMDGAIAGAVEKLTGSGVVSAAANRRAFRLAQEPLDLFREYMALYALEQAYCHFSPALIANLERHWNAKSRKAD